MDALIDPDEAPELKRQRPSAGVLNEMAAEDMGGAAPVAIPLRPTASADEAALRRAAGQRNMDRRVLYAMRSFCRRRGLSRAWHGARSKACVSRRRVRLRRG